MYETPQDHPHMISTYRFLHITSPYIQASRLKLRFKPFVAKGHSCPLLDMMLISILVTTMHRTASKMQSRLMQCTRVLVTLQRCIEAPPLKRPTTLYAPSNEQDLTRRGQNSHQVQYPISRRSQGPLPQSSQPRGSCLIPTRTDRTSNIISKIELHLSMADLYFESGKPAEYPK